MPIQNSPVPTVTIPTITFEKLKKDNCKLKELYKGAITELQAVQQECRILKTENTALKSDNEALKTTEKALIQFIDEDLQSSKTTLQYIYTIAGAILGGGAVLTFPAVGAAIAALGGAGSAAVGVGAAGAALAGGAAGGCVVAPFVHKQQHDALTQQIKNFKEQEKAQVNQNQNQ